MIDVNASLACKFLMVNHIVSGQLARYSKPIDEPVTLKYKAKQASDVIVEGQDFLVPTFAVTDLAELDSIFIGILDDAVPRYKGTKWNHVIHAESLQKGAEKALGLLRDYDPNCKNLKILCHPNLAISPNWGFNVVRDDRLPEDIAYCTSDEWPPGILVVRSVNDEERHFGQAISQPGRLFKVIIKASK